MFLTKFKKAKKGATAIEYAVLASMVSVAIIVGLEATGLAVQDKYEFVGTEIENAFQPASGGGSGNDSGGSPNLQPNPDFVQ